MVQNTTQTQIIPAVGMPVTEVLYTDRIAATITKVITPNKIEVMENEVRCLDFYGGEYRVLDTLDACTGAMIFTRRKSGRWVAAGEPDKHSSTRLWIGVRRHYVDPAF